MRARDIAGPILPVVALAALVLLALTVDLRLPGSGSGVGAGDGAGRGPGFNDGSGGGFEARQGEPAEFSAESSEPIPCWVGYIFPLGGAFVLTGVAVVLGVRRRFAWMALALGVAAAFAWLFWPSCGPVEVVPAPTGGGGGGSGERAPPIPEIPEVALLIVFALLVALVLAALLVTLLRRGGGSGRVRALRSDQARLVDGGVALDGAVPLPGTPGGAVVQAYVQAATALARAGVTRQPWETAREFATRVHGGPAAPLRELTGLYELVRHGRVEPGQATVERARALAGLVATSARPTEVATRGQ